MAAATTLNVMTLGPQAKTIQQSSAPVSSSCVIVTTGVSGNQHILSSPHQHTKTILIQQKRPTVPATGAAGETVSRSSVVVNMPTTATNTTASSPDTLRCKRRINFSHNTHLTYSSLPGHQPASVARRNARERNRVKQVNNGFATLRSHIPLSVAAALSSSAGSGSGSGSRGASKKLSKVETLRMAVEYIRSLQQLLDDHADANSTTSSTPDTGTSTLTTTISETGYYSSSPESTVTLLTTTSVGGQNYGHHTNNNSVGSHPLLVQQQSSLSPPCSEASSSPTPSYASEGSGSAVSSYAPTSVYHQQENYENYEPMSPEDEELLDVISWWQQSQ